MRKLDAIDEKLLRRLVDLGPDAITPRSDLAQFVERSEQTVRSRMRELEQMELVRSCELPFTGRGAASTGYTVGLLGPGAVMTMDSDNVSLDEEMRRMRDRATAAVDTSLADDMRSLRG